MYFINPSVITLEGSAPFGCMIVATNRSFSSLDTVIAAESGCEARYRVSLSFLLTITSKSPVAILLALTVKLSMFLMLSFRAWAPSITILVATRSFDAESRELLMTTVVMAIVRIETSSALITMLMIGRFMRIEISSSLGAPISGLLGVGFFVFIFLVLGWFWRRFN